MEPVGLALATAATVHLIITTGRALHAHLLEAKHAASTAADLRVFGIESSRNKLRALLDRGLAVHRNPAVDASLKAELDTTFTDLQTTLLAADAHLAQLGLAAAKRTRYITPDVRRARRALEASVRRLDACVANFARTLALMDPHDAHASPALLPPAVFQVSARPGVALAAGISAVQASLAVQAGRVGPDTRAFVLERRRYAPGTRAAAEADVRALAETLAAAAPPPRGVPDLAGYAEMPEQRCFCLVFALPERCAADPGVLRDALRGGGGRPALDARVGVCGALADAVFGVRSLDFVHKNVAPENVLVAKGAMEGPRPPAFLLNWRLVRKEGLATRGEGETAWWKGIYLHPTRQTEFAQQKYSMSHDIYSLGVCMLEVLLWVSFVEVDARGERRLAALVVDRARSLGVIDRNRAALGESAGASDEGDVDPALVCSDPDAVQSILVDLARTELPYVAGSRLSRLVVACLRVLEGGFGDASFANFQDARVQNGRDFMDCILETLSSINVG